MINWTTEDAQFVVQNMVLPCIEAARDVEEKTHESYMKMFDFIATRIRELDYERLRDKSFFFAFLGQMHGFSTEDLNESYKNYCDKYDELNKHILKDGDSNEQN